MRMCARCSTPTDTEELHCLHCGKTLSPPPTMHGLLPESTVNDAPLFATLLLFAMPTGTYASFSLATWAYLARHGINDPAVPDPVTPAVVCTTVALGCLILLRGLCKTPGRIAAVGVLGLLWMMLFIGFCSFRLYAVDIPH